MAKDYLGCFESSVKCNSNNAEAYQELGYVLDAYFSDYEKAEQAFKNAITLGAGYESYFGRARVLAQMGKTDDAIGSLSENACPFHDHPDIQSLRSEILDGSWCPRSASLFSRREGADFPQSDGELREWR
jgi:tetratricopeptide (TPR) repeat protein